MRRNEDPPPVGNELEDSNDIVGTELEDCPRRARVARLAALYSGEPLLR
jgi:hypothetical protein